MHEPIWYADPCVSMPKCLAKEKYETGIITYLWLSPLIFVAASQDSLPSYAWEHLVMFIYN